MFWFFKKRDLELKTICSGEIIELERVNEEVFSKKLAGDGVAIIPSDGTILSPIDGTISRIFPTNHAFLISSRSVEVMVHIGLDTVALRGEGFKRLKGEGDKVKVGDAIIEVNLEYLKSKKKDTTIPILVNSKKSIDIEDIKFGPIDWSETMFRVRFK